MVDAYTASWNYQPSDFNSTILFAIQNIDSPRACSLTGMPFLFFWHSGLPVWFERN